MKQLKIIPESHVTGLRDWYFFPLSQIVYYHISWGNDLRNYLFWNITTLVIRQIAQTLYCVFMAMSNGMSFNALLSCFHTASLWVHAHPCALSSHLTHITGLIRVNFRVYACTTLNWSDLFSCFSHHVHLLIIMLLFLLILFLIKWWTHQFLPGKIVR